MLLAALAVSTAGCHAVRPLWEPEEFLARARPPLIYVVQRDRPLTVAISNPELVGDTLRGTAANGAPVAVPWSDVLDVYARRLHGTRTLFAISSLTLVSAISVYALVQRANGAFMVVCVDLPTTAYEHDRDVECGR